MKYTWSPFATFPLHFVTTPFIAIHLWLSLLPLDHNPSLGLATKAKGLQGCRPRGSPRVKAKGSPRVTSHTPGSVRSAKEYKGVNLHTPKATPTLGDGVLVDSQNFRE